MPINFTTNSEGTKRKFLRILCALCAFVVKIFLKGGQISVTNLFDHYRKYDKSLRDLNFFCVDNNVVVLHASTSYKPRLGRSQ